MRQLVAAVLILWAGGASAAACNGDSPPVPRNSERNAAYAQAPLAVLDEGCTFIYQLSPHAFLFLYREGSEYKEERVAFALPPDVFPSATAYLVHALNQEADHWERMLAPYRNVARYPASRAGMALIERDRAWASALEKRLGDDL